VGEDECPLGIRLAAGHHGAEGIGDDDAGSRDRSAVGSHHLAGDVERPELSGDGRGRCGPGTQECDRDQDEPRRASGSRDAP
jgi:hypothetical protein